MKVMAAAMAANLEPKSPKKYGKKTVVPFGRVMVGSEFIENSTLLCGMINYNFLSHASIPESLGHYLHSCLYRRLGP